MAVTGFGILSLVAHALVSSLVLTGVMWYSLRWTPSLVFSRREFGRQMRMGTAVCGSTLLGMGNQRIVDLVVGRTLGVVSLGFLRVAWRSFETLLELGMRPVMQVTFSLFSRLQHDGAALAAAYVRLARLTATIIYPLFIGSILAAPEIIRLAFGPKWESSVAPMQILALSVITMPMIYFKSNVLLAIGKARSVVWLNVVEFGLSFGLVVLFCRHGLEAAAWANVLRVTLIAGPILWALRRHAGIRPDALLRAVGPAAASTAIMAAATLTVRLLVAPHVGAAAVLGSVVLTGVVVYILSMLLLYRSVCDEVAALAPGALGRWLRAALVRRVA
jgi:PST family polysaccharide transporter